MTSDQKRRDVREFRAMQKRVLRRIKSGHFALIVNPAAMEAFCQGIPLKPFIQQPVVVQRRKAS